MEPDPDPRIAEFDSASPEGKLRLIFLAALDIAAWLQHIDNALSEGPPLTATELLEMYEPDGLEN